MSILKNNNVRALALVGACLAMSFTMPSCPGQQAIQLQVDTLTTGHAEVAKRTANLEVQVKTANADLANIKQLMEQLGNAVQAQKASIDQLSQAMKDLDTKVSAAKAAPASKAPAKKRR